MSTVAKAAQAIDLVVRAGETRLVDLTSALGIPKSSAHRLLATLVAESILTKDERGCYLPGVRLMVWGSSAATGFDLRQVAARHMEVLRDQTGETVNFHVPSGESRLCVVARPGTYPLVPVVPIGESLPLGRGAAGIVLLAYATAELQDRVIARLREQGHQPPSAETLARVRETGWHSVCDELEPGLTAVAVGVRAATGESVGAVALGGSSARLTPERVQEILPEVLACADRIAADLPETALATSGHSSR
ncbi:MAG: IclR family transcriptional regulator [Propionibacteriaceae bacterium]|nr:IclR family transcriptional regulator [Propionibacteriaceae bacterium]